MGRRERMSLRRKDRNEKLQVRCGLRALQFPLLRPNSNQQRENVYAQV